MCIHTIGPQDDCVCRTTSAIYTIIYQLWPNYKRETNKLQTCVCVSVCERMGVVLEPTPKKVLKP